MFSMIQDDKAISMMRKIFNITASIQHRNIHKKLSIKNTHLEYADDFKGWPLLCFRKRSLMVTGWSTHLLTLENRGYDSCVHPGKISKADLNTIKPLVYSRGTIS